MLGEVLVVLEVQSCELYLAGQAACRDPHVVTGRGHGLVFTDNATTGMQTVIAQTPLVAGDEVLTTDHCYPAVLVQLRRVVEAAGAVLRIAPVPVPVPSRAAVAEAALSGLSGRTRLVVLDHVASCSGLAFPVGEIAAGCRRRGVPLLVDGARAAGVLPVDLARELEDRLLGEHRVVVPVTCRGGWQWLRVSARLYNTPAGYERLADALAGLPLTARSPARPAGRAATPSRPRG